MRINKFFWAPNKHLEEEVIKYFSLLEYYNNKYFDGSVSMLLLGSMSRGEASWKTVNGVDTIVSDIEFLTKVPINFNQIEKLKWAFDEAKRIAFPDQNSKLFHIDTGLGGSGNDLRKLEKKLITYDANVFAYCVVGPNIKDSLPVVTYNNINMQDIWEVLIHRIFSVIYWGRPLKALGQTEEYRYNLAKNSLDLMTVILVNNGRLISGFQNRLMAIRELAIDSGFKRYFEYCLSIKFSSPCQYSYTLEEMEKMFLDILIFCNNGFGMHIRNCLINVLFILRRNAGKIKRMLLIRHIPCTQKRHLRNMINYFNGAETNLDCILKDNFVLNGYPEYERIIIN